MIKVIRSEPYLCGKKCLISLEPGFFSSLLTSLQLWCCKWPLEATLGSQDPLSTEAVFSSVQALSRIWLFEIPWTAAQQASLSITNSRSLLKLMSMESVTPSNHLILCCPLLLRPTIFSSIRIFLFQWVSSSQQVARGSEFLLQHQSFQWTFRTD